VKAQREMEQFGRRADAKRKAEAAWDMHVNHSVPTPAIALTPWEGPSAYKGQMYSDRGAAHKAIVRVQAAVDAMEPTPSLEDMRTAARTRNERMAYEVNRIFRRHHPLLDRAGRIVRNDKGEPLDDDMVKLAAVDRMIKLDDRLARLYGMDAATKYEHTGPEGGAIPVEHRISSLRDRLDRLKLVQGGASVAAPTRELPAPTEGTG
ncbi:MAG: hypothetical protein ACRDXE_07470, partial [Acidimicrobiales bacterium]